MITAVAAVMAAAISYSNTHVVRRVEHATNSMKDALIEAARVSAHAAGRAEAKAEAEAENHHGH